MPFQITGATLVIPAAASVDVHATGVEIFGTDNPMDLEHGQIKEYTITLGQYRSKMTIYDMRQMGLNDEGEKIETAAFNLALTFNNGGQIVSFCVKLMEIGYTARPRNQRLTARRAAQECLDSSPPLSQFPPSRKQGTSRQMFSRSNFTKPRQ
ncbi:hypothetical protein WR25_06570 [Diploscapter pachys]|uniref:Uncharacterized protein n=1 Tax=Diploscapter pachys TaxID=2018661 RepID=A0A2A2L067_9BILA|nr:hypothetical protein WR25_06570 [Diploscapter pachys]